jgi:hypothetical protein
VLVSPRSGTFRTAARGPGTRWTSGTDRVRDTPIAPKSREENRKIFVGTAARELHDREGRETYARSDGPRPPPHRIPAWTGRSAYRAGRFRAQQWLEGKLHDIPGHTRCGSGHNTDPLSHRSRSASCKYIQRRHPETDDGTLCANFIPLVTIETNTKKPRIPGSIVCEVAHDDGVGDVQLLCRILRAAISMASTVVPTSPNST